MNEFEARISRNREEKKRTETIEAGLRSQLEARLLVIGREALEFMSEHDLRKPTTVWRPPPRVKWTFTKTALFSKRGEWAASLTGSSHQMYALLPPWPVMLTDQGEWREVRQVTDLAPAETLGIGAAPRVNFLIDSGPVSAEFRLNGRGELTTTLGLPELGVTYDPSHWYLRFTPDGQIGSTYGSHFVQVEEQLADAFNQQLK
ncbi:hypothetical protein AFL01nite_02470 [Aeromicrobium flavum]|uniref:Uncharacterized protein n=1 Tax=Aeromicrobium flavum TaxID=416568 RepID=A0A512HRC8_9ACTN|nr:hypothetical protein [Aeromicrobium flavum]GEO87920.1 hypothetical protein AFL01nite_02470 [Aeromicrobium flavum]